MAGARFGDIDFDLSMAGVALFDMYLKFSWPAQYSVSMAGVLAHSAQGGQSILPANLPTGLQTCSYGNPGAGVNITFELSIAQQQRH